MIIWNLESSALSEAINKLEKLSEEIINEQIELIEFSIKTPKALYSTELQEAYQKFEKVSSSENIIKTGIDTLVDIILENESNSLKDDSTNWLTLKVTDYDAFELVPMDDSLYEGLSGIAISLSEAYDFLDSERQRRVKECLKRIFSVLSNSYMKLPNHSFFVGKL
ncbi:TPA: lanthionine synthetase LanC family protein, partial [Streptococcus pyogenes]